MADRADELLDTRPDSLPGKAGAEAPGELLSFDSDEERYRDDGVIGRGGMGVVADYFDRRIGRRVACKQLRRDILDDPRTRARFVREARVQGQLEHPAIVPVYDIDANDDGSPFFTMKTVNGVTLAEVLAKLAAGETNPRFAQHRLLSEFSRVCLAVAYAHEHGVLHRDLKPANLILGEYGEVYVLDWGLAKRVGETEADREGDLVSSSDDMTSANALLGTPGYMAPEQIDDARSVGPAADVYALGAILFEILALEPLHERGLDALHTTRRGVEARPSVRNPARGAPPELEAAIVRATSLNPGMRGTPRQLSDVIERYLEGERDLELRKSRAAQHARSAERAVVEAQAGDAAGIEARRRAMQEINRALVLDPSNTTAMTTLAELLRRPPEVAPAEIVVEMDKQFRRNLRWISLVSASIYFSLLGFLPVLWWMGIRQPAVVAAYMTCMSIASIASMFSARSKSPSLAYISIAVVASNVGLAIATRITSPLVLIPGAAAVNAVGYAVILPRIGRVAVMIASCMTFLVPLGLELAGTISPTFVFDGGRLQILPIAVDLPATQAIALLVIASTVGVFLASFIIGTIRDRLAEAEHRLFMYAWHLRELVPKELHKSTDPMRTTRRRPSEPST